MRLHCQSAVAFLVLAACNRPAEASKRGVVSPRASSQATTQSNILPQTGSLTVTTPQPNPSPKSSYAGKSSDISTSSLRPGSRTPLRSSQRSDTQVSSDKAHNTAPSSSLSSSGPSIMTAAPIASPTAAPTSNGTISVDPKMLPITPTITPALSVAGALLMLTGVFYNLVGIRTKRLHIFLSTAYLVSLAVTILIIYVMHPPITNAIQGAYFVAAFFTGLIFGGGSVIFADVTEGLGCLLGGFCLSMWFLELRPGGLIRSTIGKAIFIAGLTIGAYSLYISRYTRPYGLIGSIAFAGATIIVLGIDCFSRAGLKEFWVYIWDLNDAMLPPHYKGPYPITRGIRVEIAATVLLFLLGVLSQMKVWKIVKQHRDQKAAAHLEEERQKDQAELDLGEKLEERNEREKVMWEAVYGSQTSTKAHQADSEIGAGTRASSKKVSISDDAADNIEMTSIRSAGGNEEKAQQSSSVTIQVGSEDDIHGKPSATAENLLSTDSETHTQSKPGSLREPSTEIPKDAALTVPAADRANAGHSPKPGLRSDPPIVPVPFNVSGYDIKDDDDRSSIATFAASDHPQSRMSKRLSGLSLLQNLPMRSKRRFDNHTPTEEASTSLNEDDRASSVAATFDGVESDISSVEKRPSSPQQTQPLAETEEGAVSKPLLSDISAPLGPKSLNDGHYGVKRASMEEAANEESWELKSIDDYVPANTTFHTPAQSVYESMAPQWEHEAVAEPQRAPSTKSATASELAQGALHSTSLRSQLPEGASKIEMAYRTNEWAKHLERAERPSIEDLKESSAVDAEPTREESAAAVNVRQLQQTALTAEPRPIEVVTNPETKASQPTYLNRSASSSLDSLPSQRNRQNHEATLRRASYGSLVDRNSSQNPLHNPRGIRNSSSGMHSSPLVGSPIEEGVESFFPPRGGPTPPALHAHTLMAKRNSKLQSKYSTTSLARTNSSNSLTPDSPLDSQEAENMPLAQRKSLLKRQSRRSSHPASPRTSAAYVKRHPSSEAIHPSENRDSMASAWRTSLRNDSKANILSQQELERKRSQMLGEKRRVSADLQAAGEERARRESLRDGNMRRGDMLDRHREAMRRLQASANI